MRPPPRRASAGYTLVELLVVLAVTGMLIGLTTTAFRAARDSWQRVSSHDRDRRTLLAVRDLIDGILSQAYPAVVKADGTHRAIDFEGQPDRIIVLAPLRQRFGAGDIARYALRFTDDGSFEVWWRLDRSGADAGQSQVERSSGFQGASFSYFGPDDSNDTPHWQTTWRLRKVLPSLVRVRLVRDSQASSGQEFTVAPLISRTACQIQDASACVD